MHMPLNRDQFSEFRTIALKGVKAVNKTIFMATRMRSMKIDMPNRWDSTTITLKDVSYCTDLGYMLVSLAKCDTASFTVTLKNKSCCIKDTKGLQIG